MMVISVIMSLDLYFLAALAGEVLPLNRPNSAL